eukprot:3474187-Alexandrium_andersonii.AAC.1
MLAARISQSPRGRLKQLPLHACPAGGSSLRITLRVRQNRASLGSLVRGTPRALMSPLRVRG